MRLIDACREYAYRVSSPLQTSSDTEEEVGAVQRAQGVSSTTRCPVQRDQPVVTLISTLNKTHGLSPSTPLFSTPLTVCVCRPDDHTGLKFELLFSCFLNNPGCRAPWLSPPHHRQPHRHPQPTQQLFTAFSFSPQLDCLFTQRRLACITLQT